MLRSRLAAAPVTANSMAAHHETDCDKGRSGGEQTSGGLEMAAGECATQHEEAALQPPASPRHAKRPTVHTQAEAGGARGERERGEASGLWFVMNGGGQAAVVGREDEVEEGEVRSEDGEEGEEEGEEEGGAEAGFEMEGEERGAEIDGQEEKGEEVENAGYEEDDDVIEVGPGAIGTQAVQQRQEEQMEQKMPQAVQVQEQRPGSREKHKGGGMGRGEGGGAGGGPTHPSARRSLAAAFAGAEGTKGADDGRKQGAFMGPGPQTSPLAAGDKERQVCLVKPCIDATVYLVIDNLEQLKAFPAGEGPQLLETFLRLPELLGQSNLGLILELETVLVGMRPNQPLFLSFLRQVVPVYSRACRSLPHLVSLVDHSWPLYTTPITTGTVSPDHPSCARLLYMRAQEHIGATLKQPVSTLVRSSVMDTTAVAAATASAANSPFHGMYPLQCTLQQPQQQQQMMLGWGPEAPMDGPDLPIMARFALVAAFTCSRNPAPSDSTLFNFSDSLQAGGAGFRSRRKRKASAADLDKQAREAREAQQQGPIPFALSRWLFMAHHLVKAHWSSPLASVASGGAAESAPAVDDSLLTQLATLIRGGLVSQSGEDRLASTTRFKCSARKELVKQVANTLGIRLEQLLLFG
ncbi:unnamed protein product [Closterium sp. Yama58-4]|nr:unnamed protein product [Closterium sp. Yama58-4]